jgi:hypothetical protein
MGWVIANWGPTQKSLVGMDPILEPEALGLRASQELGVKAEWGGYV